VGHARRVQGVHRVPVVAERQGDRRVRAQLVLEELPCVQAGVIGPVARRYDPAGRP